jgi:hypothetical protein
MKSISLAVIGLLFSGWACGQDANTADAVALVRAMRADVMLMEVSKAGLSRATSEGHYTAAQFKCVEQLPASALTAELGTVLSKVLTQEEITRALEFYASPVGVKFMDMKFVAFAKAAAASGVPFGGKPSVPEPSMTNEEMQATRSFIESPLGEKIENDRALLNSPDALNVAKRILRKKLADCGAKVPPPP